MNHIGDNIRRMRESAKLSQQELADKSGISKAQISRLENGAQKNPQIQTVIALATELGTTVEELIFGEESTATTYLNQAINNLPEEDQKAIKKLIKVWVIMTQSEKWEE
ncbi:TPA: helix-turn-helix transcriptional regulator [Escherichia coli]|uniref:helix-turn-helix domain-containing protein n=1 Tax=Escherichia coli TaxID=562 RepID=UPI000F045F5F|nr:helix-turn-helix transcriptional regulator [Escherichia coli]EFF0756995.1 helix-turn-helix transcriptional regulator [Escherichia coli]EIP8029105.1 helix-turn-helix domain-containing protein [Escherichia coli]EKE2651806.1 helix-turn-helix domain-containing protein [Escherichia coli]EKI7037351.1 helix-turn-helix domain-containing protein [Escherichia coli]MBB7250626.1 helix-turn-helix domain-containing protein [Escherichia coli]